MANAQPGSSDRDTQRSTDEFAQTAKGEADAAKEQARKTAAEMKEDARGLAEDVKEQARATTAKQKDAAAEQIDGWAHALNTASDDLRDRGQESAAAWVRQAAAGLQRASGTMRERGVDDLFGTVEDFARRQPVAFLGGAVIAGFGLARLMKSSADRRGGAADESHFGTAAEGRFGEGAGTAAGTHYGEGGGL
jgi:F0F1-type ATP synthase membrane subunit b/b'